MNKYEVRFQFTTSALKIVKFDSREAANRYYRKVRLAAEKSKKHGKIAIWKNGWLETGECF